MNIDLRHQYGIADVPPPERSPAASNEEKGLFSQAIRWVVHKEDFVFD